MEDWMPEPTVPDLRVPVFLTPDSDGALPPEALDLDAAQHTLVAVIVDDHMADFIDGEAETWSDWLSDLCRMNPPGSRHHVVPIVVDDTGFDVVKQRHSVNVVGDSNVPATVSFALSVRALHLLRDATGLADVVALATPGRQLEAPIKLFVSHAKKDLEPRGLDPVRLTLSAASELPLDTWFDARNIRYGANFDEDIRKGIGESDVVLIFLTDSWSTRPWCVAEGLLAKELATPTLVVDVLINEEARSFPYGGNTRTLRWRPSTVPGPDDNTEAFRSRGRSEGKRVLAAAVRRALMVTHARKRLEDLAQPCDTILDSPPEAARIAFTSAVGSFLYPDPPISADERRVLEKLFPNADFVTPMIRFARRRKDERQRNLAISVSMSEDLGMRGLTNRHQHLITDEVYLYLLLTGLQITYGGMLEPNRLDDYDNFTARLVALVRRYANLASDAGSTDGFAPIINTAPWPLWMLYDREVTKVFRNIAKIDRIGLPKDFGVPLEQLEPDERGFVEPGSALQLYAWARALTHMRELVTSRSIARVVMGGRMEGYKGRMAGLLEESLVQLRASKPLFLVGSLGGCTKLVIDLLEGRERPEMQTETARTHARCYDELIQLYERYGGEMPTREAIANELRERGRDGIAGALNNGLDDAQNQELFTTTDPVRIAELILSGLSNFGGGR